jgi:N-acetylglucosaminyldiphosphoundecaprenol N-acetyl-beta-D-mannosaminyltransferase
MQKVRLFGLPILNTSKKEFFATLQDSLLVDQAKATLSIFTPNPEQVVLTKQDPAFAKNLQQADYLLADGIGLVWASRLLKLFGRLPAALTERLAGVEVVEYLLDLAQQHELKALVIGGRDYKGSYQGESFEDQSSLLKIGPNLYWTEAYQEKNEILPVEEQSLAAIIKKLQPSLVFVALGAPDQEKWIVEHLQLLQSNRVRIAMAVGGSFDFILAKVPRAPQLVQKIGLEWLYRLIKQPWRYRRQLRLLAFIKLTWREILAT